MRLTDLEADLDAVFRAVHGPGRAPYAWQVRATEELFAHGFWPALHAPTGAGKTSLIECWLVALAAAETGDLPRRMFWVVDRRAVIDQVHAYGVQLFRRLAQSTEPSCAGLHRRLCAIGGAEPPEVRLWRGALDDDQLESAARQPLTPSAVTLVCTTVDQLGSRLLFSGYGVSPRSRPLHAGLAALDSVVMLDEAHLSTPFRETVQRVASLQRHRRGPAAPLDLVTVSATPDPEAQEGFSLQASELGEPAIAKRVGARKVMSLIQAGADQTRTLGKAAQAARKGGASVVGVVANTVASARAIHTALSARGESVLVIGPVRPLDREGLLRAIPARTREERSDLFVVGTQTLEVGLDLDFDALVTACAPLSALTQRLGRLDRAGVLGESEVRVVGPPKAGCPVYGEATAAAWDWLVSADQHQDGAADLGVAGLDHLRRAFPPPVEPRGPHAPMLTSVHVEALERTGFRHPWPIEIAPFLRGQADERAEVTLAWRADLLPRADTTEWVERGRARPPHPGELLSVALTAARRWLRGEGPGHLADVEGIDEARPGAASGSARTALRIPPPSADGELDPHVVSAEDLRPGDVLLVPSAYGGADRFGWAPEAGTMVGDLGSLGMRRPAILLTGGDTAGPLAQMVGTVRADMDEDELTEREAFQALAPEVADDLRRRAPESRHKARMEAVADRLGAGGGHATRVGAGDLVLVPDRQRDRRAGGTPQAVTLAAHVALVERRAREWSDAVGLTKGLIVTVSLAARYHDLGKLDPRFQRWMTDGVSVREPIAKSLRPRGWHADEAARAAAGWPKGKRHELLSAAAVEQAGIGARQDVDADLLVHLIVAHHGYGRPFFRVLDDPNPPPVDLMVESSFVHLSGDAQPAWGRHAERFARLSERFGPWGLALLESILVLADRAASAEEAG